MNITLMIVTFFISMLMVYLLIGYAQKLGLVDLPNERSVHKKPTPRGGGIGFIAAVFVSTLFLDFSFMIEHYYIYLSILIVFFVGVLDDKKNITPLIKFVVIFMSTLILYFNDVYISSLGFYLGYELVLPALFVLPFTYFAIAGFTNALNLIDGLDGLAGFVSIVMLSAFLAIGLIHSDTLIITLSSTCIAAVAAFILFNWHPAKIFMGDSGSLTLGFIIAVLSIKALAYATPASILFIVAIPILDTFIVITRRIQRGISPFKADKNHLHHFLYKVKLDVKFTVILIVYIQIAFSIIGFQLSQTNNLLSLILFGILFFIFLNLFDQRIKRRHKHGNGLQRANQTIKRDE